MFCNVNKPRTMYVIVKVYIKRLGIKKTPNRNSKYLGNNYAENRQKSNRIRNRKRLQHPI